MKFKRMLGISAMGCLALLFLAAVASQAQAGQASAADKTFVKAALKGGNAEIELGKLATQKGASDDVKQFGQQMVDDHGRLGDQMKSVAGQIGVEPPTTLTPMDKALEVRLQALSGDDFDKAYIKAMLKDHEKDLAAFQKEANTGTSSAVKDAAAQGQQVVSAHLDMIREIAAAHNVTVQSKADGSAQ